MKLLNLLFIIFLIVPFVVSCGNDKASDADNDSIIFDQDNNEPVDGEDDADLISDDETEGDIEENNDEDNVLPVFRGECPLDKKLGTFSVRTLDDYPIVNGTVSDSVNPVSILTEVKKEGRCSLLKKENPVCEPNCNSEQVCDLSGKCIDRPVSLNVGTVELKGLLKNISMEPVQPGNKYFDTTMEEMPPYNIGNKITLTSIGGSYIPLKLFGAGVELLTLKTQSILIQNGTDLIIEWDKPKKELGTKIHIKINIDQHGASPVSLFCLFDDTGSASIPSSIIEALLNSGVSGYPSGLITRKTVDSMDFENGCVDFEVSVPKELSVNVDGVTPCKNDEDCPDGQTCNLEIEICE